MPVELLKLTNLGRKGLSTDTHPWELPAEALTYGINFRILAGALTTAGGYKLWSESPVNFNPAHLINVRAGTGNYWIVCGRSAVYVYDGDSWTDASSSEGYSALGADDELLWSSCMIGSIPIINNPQSFPEYWSPQMSNIILKRLMFDNNQSWDDKAYQAKVFRSHRNFLFALNLVEGGIDFPDTYRWSHPADINGLPASWDETDNSFLAGKASLGGDGGRIIDGRSLKNAFCMYSEGAIDILDYSNDEYVWNRRELSSTIGLLSQNCLVEVKGVQFFLADGDIMSNDGTTLKSIAHNRIRKHLNSHINNDYYHRSFVVRNTVFKEIWFCVASNNSTYPDLVYIYNYADDSWAIRDLPYTRIEPASSSIQSGIAHIGYGSKIDPSLTWEDFNDKQRWKNQKRTWGSIDNTALDSTLVGINPATIENGGGLYLLDPSDTPDNDISMRLERTDYPLIDSRQVTTMTRAFPHIIGTATVNIQFGSQDHPGAIVRWQPAIEFTPGIDRKVDFRSTGELHCYRIDSIGKGDMSISGMDIEYVRNGER